jgi:hypothetical protein
MSPAGQGTPPSTLVLPLELPLGGGAASPKLPPVEPPPLLLLPLLPPLLLLVPPLLPLLPVPPLPELAKPLPVRVPPHAGMLAAPKIKPEPTTAATKSE